MTPTMKELLARISWSLSSIQATVGIVDFDNAGEKKPLLVVEVISDLFENMPSFSRTLLVDDTLDKRDPKLNETLELAYECYTRDEHALGLRRAYQLH